QYHAGSPRQPPTGSPRRPLGNLDGQRRKSTVQERLRQDELTRYPALEQHKDEDRRLHDKQRQVEASQPMPG
ncbi:MAG: hypothetical protein M3P51_15255, partial [Chloroflexota bacterium]|nr:hypothetical protein [Chloroflexota bacterium]